MSKWTIKDLLDEEPQFHLEYVEEEDVVLTVIQKMKQRNISSLPVRDKSSKKFVGIIDVLDIVTFACTKYATVSTNAYESYQQMETFAKTKCSYLLNISGRNAWKVLSENRPLSDLLVVLSNPHIHRVGIINRHHDIVGLVSEIKVIQFLWRHREELGPRAHSILSSKVELWTHVHSQELVTISENAQVYDAFQTIWEQEVTGLAVVNDDGKLVANISASDIKRCRFYPIIGQMVKDLYQPIKAFLKIPAPGEEIRKKHHVPFYVHQHDTMAHVIETVIAQHIHRVFVVDAKHHPIAVISLVDIIKRLWSAQ